jgi:RAT1-interacting protein
MPVDFVCYRGLLTMLMCTPYEKDDDWIICATKWKGTIFLCARETDKKRLYREQMTDKQKQFMSWGYKFEQYMSSGNFTESQIPYKVFMYHTWKGLNTN